MDSLIFTVLTTLFGYVALITSALCIACGLYCLAEVAEEYSSLAKRVLKGMLLAVAVFHALFLVAGVPFFTILVSLLCQLCYASLLPSFPFVDPFSLPSLAAMAGVLVSHYAWFNFFASNYTPIFQVTGFFLIVIWSVPLGFFVSLSIGDDALPVGALGERVGSKGSGAGNAGGNAPKQTNAFKFVFDAVAKHYNNFVNKQSPGLGKFK
jgi:hypothetical protein